MDNYLGQIIGNRYEVQDIIGIGGMSVVYKAYDRVDDRVVAVKILKDEFLANQEFRLRFKNESKAIAVLSHPNIVKVYDVSFGETLQYIVMEYVEGITLKEFIVQQGTLTQKDAVHFTMQILRALQHAHDKGIVHRDIKPQNIMVLPNFSIKVADFGIARFSRAESRNINENTAIGSVHYISPEQARGEYTDGRADIYSVGVALYEMLTGRLPFQSDSDVSVALMHMKEDAVSPRAINAEIPRGLEQITMRAMQKNPADRYQSAAEFLQDLEEFRRNPQVEFDYGYFLDSSPTRHLGTEALSGSGDRPVRIMDEEDDPDAAFLPDDPSAGYDEPYTDDAGDEDAYDDDYDEEDENKNRLIKILIGVSAGFILLVILILVLAFGRQFKELLTGRSASAQQTSEGGSWLEKIDLFGWFSGEKIEIPNFINMTFDEALARYPELKIENPPQYVYNPGYETGVIFEQDPGAGKKLPADTVIRLTVAKSSDDILIKNVIGMTGEEAEAALKAQGFTVVLVPTADGATEENKVITTNPSPNTYLASGETVTVYYAVPEEVTEISVPNVVGDQLVVARKKLAAAGLNVGSVTYGASSAALKDYVIGQDPSADEDVEPGEYVNLVIGNGVPANTTASFRIYLPDTEGGVGTIKTYLNNNVYNIVSDVTLDGSDYGLSFTGSGKDNSFKIYVDSTLIYSGKIDFTTEPPEISDVSTYTYSTKETIPDVVGLPQQDAEDRLRQAGFKNIRIENVTSDTMFEGYVCEQSPISSSLTQYQTTTVVMLKVSLGPGPGVSVTAADPYTSITAYDPLYTPTEED